MSDSDDAEDDGLFGPGMDLVLSLFAIMLVVGSASLFMMKQRTGPEFRLSLGDALFERDRTALTVAGRNLVRSRKPDLYEALRDDAYHVELVGEASAEGPEAFNFTLGLGRARSVADELMVPPLPLPPSCIQVRALGSSRSLRRHQADRLDTLPEQILRVERRVLVRVVRDTRARCTLHPAPHTPSVPVASP